MFKKFFENINNEIQKAFKEEHVQQKCENCGAMVEGTNREEVITCKYCGGSQKNNFYKPLFDVNNQQGSNVDSNFGYHSGVNNRHYAHGDMHHHKHGAGYGVFAWVNKGGLFFEGDIPGLNFCKVSLCDSFDECVEKLRQKYYEQKSRAFFEPPKQDMEEIKNKYPKARIIRLD